VNKQLVNNNHSDLKTEEKIPQNAVSEAISNYLK